MDIYGDYYTKCCEEYGIPRELLLKVHYQESKFDHLAVSTGNCFGVGQLSSYFYAEERQGKATGFDNINPFNIRQSIKRSAEALAQKYNSFSPYNEPERSNLAMIAYCSGGDKEAKKYLENDIPSSNHWYVKAAARNYAQISGEISLA